MSATAGMPRFPITQPWAPIAPRCTPPSGRKNAHRGLAVCRRPASGKSRPQAPAASGKNRRSPTTARRAHLLPQTKPSKNPLKNSPLCKALQSAAAHNAAITGDLAGALGVGGALHASVSPDSINIFIGAGIGGGGEIGAAIGPSFEHNTDSIFGVRTYATAGAGAGLGAVGTMTAGSNGVSVSGGVGTVEGAVAETGYGLDINLSISLVNALCK